MREDVPANHEIMKHQRTFYDFDKIVWGMVPLRAYGYDYPKNMARLPTLAAFFETASRRRLGDDLGIPSRKTPPPS